MENQNNPAAAGEVQEVNLDALVAEEGNYHKEMHGNGKDFTLDQPSGLSEEQILNNDKLLENLPNLDRDDLTKQIVKLENENNNNGNPDLNNKDNANKDNTNNNEIPYYRKPFERIKANLEKEGGSLEIPEDLNEENYMEYLDDVLTQLKGQTNTETKIHPELAKLQKAIEDGIPFEQAIETYGKATDWRKLNDEELMSNHLKQNYPDATPEKIKSIITKLDSSGLLELEVNKIRQDYNAKEQNALQNITIENQKRLNAHIAEVNSKREAQINETISALEKIDNVYGLPLSKAEKDEFIPFFKKVVTPDETKVSPLLRYMQSNENVLKVAMMMFKGEDKIKAELSKAKESGKDIVFNKLNPNPINLPKAGSGSSGSNVDMDALAAPERIN